MSRIQELRDTKLRLSNYIDCCRLVLANELMELKDTNHTKMEWSIRPDIFYDSDDTVITLDSTTEIALRLDSVLVCHGQHDRRGLTVTIDESFIGTTAKMIKPYIENHKYYILANKYGRELEKVNAQYQLQLREDIAHNQLINQLNRFPKNQAIKI